MYKRSVSSEYLFVTWKFVYIIVQTKLKTFYLFEGSGFVD